MGLILLSGSLPVLKRFLTTVIHELPVKFNDRDLWNKYLILQIDTDNNGVIDFEEFLLMMTKHKRDGANDVRSDLQQAFEVLW